MNISATNNKVQARPPARSAASPPTAAIGRDAPLAFHEALLPRKDTPRVLTATVTLKQIGDEILGTRQRTTRKITDEDWFPQAVTPASTSRIRRWLRAEILEALATRAPRATKAPEPAALAAARDRKVG